MPTPSVHISPNLIIELHPRKISASLKSAIMGYLVLDEVKSALSVAIASNRMLCVYLVFLKGDEPEPAELLVMKRLSSAREVFLIVGMPSVIDSDYVRAFVRNGNGRIDFLCADNLTRLSEHEFKVKLRSRLISLLVENEKLHKQARDRIVIDAMPEVSEALREHASGRLHARMVAEFFGISQARLAIATGMTKQHLGFSPMGDVMQRRLIPFEWAAKLGVKLFGNSHEFCSWLHCPNNRVVGSKKPYDLIMDNQMSVVIDLLEQMYGDEFGEESCVKKQ